MSQNTTAEKVIPWIVAIALFMETLDMTIISTATPNMAISFMVNPLSLKFAMTSYLLSIAMFIPISGWVADKWGTQRTFICALILFTLSSFACGNARFLPELVIARFFQGMGGAFMMPVGRLIILRTFKKSQLIRTMNFVTTPALLGPLLGPVLGGFIATYYSWPWIFYINIPIGLLGVLAAWYCVKNHKMESIGPFDTIGFLLFSLSLVGIFFALETISAPFIPTYIVVLVGSCALLGFLVFYWHYHKTRYPVLNLKLFSIRTFFVAALGNLWSRPSIFSVSFILPLLFQIGFGLSPLHSGLLTCFSTLGMISSKSINRVILHHFGFRKALCVTSVLTGITIASYSLINEINVPIIIVMIFINGLVTSLLFSGMNVLYYVDVARAELSHATSISSTLQQLSMGLGITLSTLVLQLFVGWNHPLAYNDPAPFRWAFLVMGVIAILSVLVFLKLKPSDGHEMT